MTGAPCHFAGEGAAGTPHAVRVIPLSRRVRDNSTVLLKAYRSSTQALQTGQTVTPATEWLLDNYHMVERQLEQIARDLPPGCDLALNEVLPHFV